MKKQAYQKPELRDENDKIVQEGTYGKHSPICSSTNDGIIDYINNNLEALHDSVTGSGEIETTNLTVTGETSVPTANVGNKSKAIANTEFVQNTVADLVNGAPDTLNTLDELAQALGDDPNFATAVATELGKKANKADVANTYLDKLSKTEQVVTAPIKGTLNGNAASATKLETARTINITDADGTNTGTGASFDGTANATVKLPATIKANLTGNADTATHATNATNADTATNATNDGNGNNIASTYLPAVVGAVVAFAGSTTPQGWLLCDGSAVSRKGYAALYAVIGTTYGRGNGSTTFNLPNLVDKFVEGSATAGTVKSAGLPNIVAGTITTQDWGGIETKLTGAWVETSHKTTVSNVGGGSSADEFVFTFNASHSNSIYGNSTTVQPPALTMRYIIKY